MYGSNDNWNREFFLLLAIAKKQNALLKKVLKEIKNTELMKEVALGIVNFSQRIATISKQM